MFSVCEYICDYLFGKDECIYDNLVFIGNLRN